MRTLSLTVAYDGTDWAGFQRQRLYPSVQGALETALASVLRHPVTLVAAGRTDAGVHAWGQVVSVETTSPIPIERIPFVTNRFLPASIRVRRASERPAGFHARRHARSRRYWYVVQDSGGPDPMRGRFQWQIGHRLCVTAMQEALRPLCGRHDFRAFCHEAAGAGVTTVRTVQRGTVYRWHDRVIIDVQADAFLRQMVRLLVANLVLIGRAERPVGWLEDLLQGRNRDRAGMGAPPCGLFLMRVGYPARLDLPVGENVGELNDEELSG